MQELPLDSTVEYFLRRCILTLGIFHSFLYSKMWTANSLENFMNINAEIVCWYSNFFPHWPNNNIQLPLKFQYVESPWIVKGRITSSQRRFYRVVMHRHSGHLKKKSIYSSILTWIVCVSYEANVNTRFGWLLLTWCCYLNNVRSRQTKWLGELYRHHNDHQL